MTIHLDKTDKENPIHSLLHDVPNGSLIFLEAKIAEDNLFSTWNMCQTSHKVDNTQNWLFLHPIWSNIEGVMA